MANVNIKFNGKEFLLSCDDGQEEHLEELALYLNEKFKNLKNSLGNIGESKLLLITSITILDEYYETKKKIDSQKNEIKNITDKFKELKNLVYNYRDLKEKEISGLSKNQDNLKDEIEINKNNYESIVDKVTNEIENFIKKNNPDTKIQ
jgi:cell division protein ZapA|tara:strand:- start:242 stop:688 length:447 start_codon:yes stop_codon:yes gene_type:complete